VLCESVCHSFILLFFFQAEDGIRDFHVTGVQTCALPIFADGVEVTCPSCGEATFGRLDPLQFALPHSGAILREIHLIARAYGWSLGDILALKARQRSNFAEMIRRDRPSSRTGWGGRWWASCPALPRAPDRWARPVRRSCRRGWRSAAPECWGARDCRRTKRRKRERGRA